MLGGVVAIAGSSLSEGDAMGSDFEFDRIMSSYAPAPFPQIEEKDNWASLVRNFQNDNKPLRWPEHEWKNRKERLAECETAGYPAIVDEIAKRPYFFEESKSELFPVGTTRLRDLSDFLALRARMHGASGDANAALKDVGTLRHMALSYAQYGTGGMQQEAAADLVKANFVTIELLTRSRLSRDQIQALIDQPVPDFGGFMKQAFRRDIQGQFRDTLRCGWFGGEPYKHETWVLLDRPTEEAYDFLYGRYDRIATAKLLGTLVQAYEKDVDEGNGLNLVNYRAAENGLGIAWGDMDFRPGVAQRIDAGRRALQVHQQENVRGRGLLQFTPVTFSLVQPQAGYDLTRLAAAVALYKIDHGALPGELEDLVKVGTLKEIPLDRLCGKPFCYDAERRVLWSRGRNGALDPEDEVAEGLSANFK